MRLESSASLALLGLAGIVGYGLYTTMPGISNFFGKSEKEEPEAPVDFWDLPEEVPEFEGELPEQGTIEKIVRALIPDVIEEKIMDAPTQTVTEAEISIHKQLVFEYLQRHPALTISDYYAELPHTAWIQPYAFPALDLSLYEVKQPETATITRAETVMTEPITREIQAEVVVAPAPAPVEVGGVVYVGGGYTEAQAEAAGAEQWVPGVGWI